ncbi:tripartite motif-containing protein 60-like [Epinephelus moara]|uniref:tripartite motif-containing protein 60-like n=1 Tax=Epinephelus moara TaxID=300413 RepID=UPI00214EF813|nr:tripartite motif-containing protein 60-like [Epinephelus moara]
MASASSLLYEEQLLCSICLDAFNEPVTTPCGHNYCKSCITGYWVSSNQIQCPLCKRKFRKRPQLQVNTEFRDMVEQFNNMKVRGEDDIPAKPGEVPCDICLEPKRKAQKTCLVCLASYCQTHLEPHQRVTTLKKHQLINPVSNLEDRVCKKHDKMFEFFCYTDQACICSMCLKDNHATHGAVPLEHAFRDRKAQVGSVTSELKNMENIKSRNIKEIKSFLERNKRRSEKEIADIAEVFTALLVSLQRSQTKLFEVIQEKQKAARKEAEDHLTKLEQEVAELRRKRSEMEQLLQTDDHFSLLQSCPSLSVPAHTVVSDALTQATKPIDLTDISQQSFVEKVKKAGAQVEKMLNNKTEMIIHEVRLSDGCEAAERTLKEVWSPPEDKLMMIQQCNAMDVTLDTYSANSRLLVSADGKQLRFHKGLPFALFGRRFQHQAFVLGKEGFSTGRFYYEVQVSGSKGWLLGVVKESLKREILHYPTPGDGGWTLGGFCDQIQEMCFVTSDCSARLFMRQTPQKVGVFVDYEKGEVSFYDMDDRSVIHSHTRCAFIETPTVLKALLYSMAGTSLSGRQKLYPIFGIIDDDPDNMLEITPVTWVT